MSQKYKCSFLRLMIHLPYLIFFLIMFCWTIILFLPTGGFTLVFVPFLFLLPIASVGYILIQYLREDWGKVVELKNNKLVIKEGSNVQFIDISKDIKHHILVIAGGYKNIFEGYGYIQILLKNNKKVLITSLVINPKKIRRYLHKIAGKELTIGFPRIGIDTTGKGEELIGTIFNLGDRNKSVSFNTQVSYFIDKFKDKSIEELNEMIQDDKLADYAIQACKILKNRLNKI